MEAVHNIHKILDTLCISFKNHESSKEDILFTIKALKFYTNSFQRMIDDKEIEMDITIDR